MFHNFYTTQMSGNAKALQKRFAKIRVGKSKTARFMAIIMTVAVLAATLGGAAVMASFTNDDTSIVYEVYKGENLLRLKNKPFIYDEEILLPLRETLNGFGIYDIRWHNGNIEIHFAKMIENKPQICMVEIGSEKMKYEKPKQGYNTMRTMLIQKNSITYAPLDFFEQLIAIGQLLDFRTNVVRPLSPKNYYSYGEEVFIGTGKEQDEYNPTDENGNKKYVKRIVIDDNGDTIAVVPIENQMPDNITAKLEKSGEAYGFEGYTNLFDGVQYTPTPWGNFETTRLVIIIQNEKEVACIPLSNQIKIPVSEHSKSIENLVRIVDNPYRP